MKKDTATPIDLHKVFELGSITPEQADVLASHLEQMVQLPGWLLLKQVLEGNMAVIEKAIVTKIDPQTAQRMSEVEADEYRIQHAQINQLLKKPSELIQSFRGDKSEKVVESFDPYQQSTDKKAERLRGMASTLAE